GIQSRGHRDDRMLMDSPPSRQRHWLAIANGSRVARLVQAAAQGNTLPQFLAMRFPRAASARTELAVACPHAGNQEDPRFGTVSTNPMVTEIIDERLFSDLKKAGISDSDARHLMYAIHNKCDRFVTLDTRDL